MNTERIKIENVDYHTDFTIVNAVRRDTGKYTLRAENCNGFDEETVELTVLSKPSSPKGKMFNYSLFSYLLSFIFVENSIFFSICL